MILSEQEIRDVVSALQEKPFDKKTFRYIDLDRKSSEQWSDILFEVCSSIDNSFNEDITAIAKEEEKSMILLKLMVRLRCPYIPKDDVLSSSPPTREKLHDEINSPTSLSSSNLLAVNESDEMNSPDEVDESNMVHHNMDPRRKLTKASWGEQLVQGTKQFVLPVIAWLLRHREELKERMYLGKYLVPIKVPLNLHGNTRSWSSSNSGNGANTSRGGTSDISSIGGRSRGLSTQYGRALSSRGTLLVSTRGVGSGRVQGNNDDTFQMEELLKQTNRYTEMQEEFKEIHKEYKEKLLKNDQAMNMEKSSKTKRHNPISLVDLMNRKDQLERRIKGLEDKHMGRHGGTHDEHLEAMIEACANLRQAEQEQKKMIDQRVDQEYMYDLALKTRDEMLSRASTLNELQERSTTTSDGTIESTRSSLLLQYMEDVAKGKKMTLKHEILPEILAQKEEIEQLKKSIEQVLPNNDEIENVVNQLEDICDDVDHIESRIVEATQYDTNAKQRLQTFRQESKLFSDKMENKKKSNEKKEHELKLLRQHLLLLQQSRRDMAVNLVESDDVNDEQIDEFLKKQREDAISIGKLRDRLSQEYNRREKLKDSRRDIVNMLEAHEKQLIEEEIAARMKGCRDVIRRKVQTSDEIAKQDEEKSGLLQEIASVNKKIVRHVEDNKNRLMPLLEEMNMLHKKENEIEFERNQKQPQYDEMAAEYAKDIQDLEHRCDHHRDGLIEAERRFHLLHAKIGIVESDIQKAEYETQCHVGKERFTKDYKTTQDYYNAMVTNNEKKTNALSKQQQEISRTEAYRLEQKQIFTIINKLLELKLEQSENVVDFNGALSA